MLAKLSGKIRSLLSATINGFTEKQSQRFPALILGQPVFIASIVVTVVIQQVTQLGILQPLELAALDRMMRSHPDGEPDPRLLVVAITEADIQTLKQLPLSDRTVSQIIEKLQKYQPKVIGLDLYRNIPQPPGNQALHKQLQAGNVIAINKLVDVGEEEVPPPPDVPPERVGFNDLVLDPDGVVRRNLIFASTGKEEFYSFSLRLCLSYLTAKKLPFKVDQNSLLVGKTEFVPLEENSGGYQTIDARGYQVLLKYRSANQVARQVTVTQVLRGQINPEWVKDKIVLIGTTAPSAKDLFNTPYSASLEDNLKMSGVILHAQMVSQILSAVIDGRSLFWFFPQWSEILWVWCWSLLGGMLAMRIKHSLSLAFTEAAAGVGLVVICYGIFIQLGWVPLVAPSIAFLVTSACILIYKQTNLEADNQQLQRLVSIDGLTQIANRRRFDEYLAIEWLRMAREQQPLSLILCDVDYFKRYNDTYGHIAGDTCLQWVAGAISRGVKRPADLVARYGGEEFAVVLPNTNALGAVQVAELVRHELNQLMIPHAASAVSEYVSLSLGVSSTIPTQEFSLEQLIAAADKALYEAKEQGRNRVVVKSLQIGIGH